MTFFTSVAVVPVDENGPIAGIHDVPDARGHFAEADAAHIRQSVAGADKAEAADAIGENPACWSRRALSAS